MGLFIHDCHPPKHKGLWDRKQQRHNGEIWQCPCGRKFRGRVYAHPSGWRLVWHPVGSFKPAEVNLFDLRLTPQGQHRAKKTLAIRLPKKKVVFDVPR